MSKVKAFLKYKNIVISPKRYGIDALGAMAQGLFCSLLIGFLVLFFGASAVVSSTGSSFSAIVTASNR